jgi:hypothetical protein
MLATLEGVLIALLVVFAPVNASRAEPQNAVLAHAKAHPSSCLRYSAESAQRSCMARVLNAMARTDDMPYPSRVDWVAPPEPSMSQSAMLLRLPR